MGRTDRSDLSNEDTPTVKMKFTFALLVLLPLAFSAVVDEKRFIDSLLGGYDIFDLAKQVVSQFGTKETEQQWEQQFCPDIVNNIDGHNALITNIVCAAVCKEAQVLASAFLTTPP